MHSLSEGIAAETAEKVAKVSLEIVGLSESKKLEKSFGGFGKTIYLCIRNSKETTRHKSGCTGKRERKFFENIVIVQQKEKKASQF